MLVIDASVAVKLVTRESGSLAAGETVASVPDRIAPDYVAIEVASALARKVRQGVLPMSEALTSLEALPVFLSELAPTGPLLPAAMRLSDRLKHPLYDCLYLSLAEHHRCPLLTADAAFAARLTEQRYPANIQVLVGN